MNVKLLNPKTGGEIETKALIDTGATYTVVPVEIARKLGLENLGFVDVKTASGSERLWESEVRIRMFDRERSSPILVSEKIDVLLIGVVTLEILRLKVDSTTGIVEELPLLLYTVYIRG
ncbi:MAG: retroviral-like aspartic protease family protein [Candidatus Bathyarchaeia archaeon]